MNNQAPVPSGPSPQIAAQIAMEHFSPYDLPCELIVMLEMKREGFEVLKVEKARAKA